MFQVWKIVVLIAISVAHLVQSFPLETSLTSGHDGRWLIPCGGSSPVSGDGTTLTIIPLPSVTPSVHTLTMLKSQVPAANHKLTSIDTKLRDIITSSFISDLDSYPQLTGMPSTQTSYTPGIQIKDFLIKEVNRLSAIGVFLEEIINDVPEYVNDVRDLENAYVSILCRIHTMLDGLNEEYPNTVTREIMPSGYRNVLETAQQDMRNYLIVRDAKKVFQTLESGISDYMLEHNLS